MVLCGNGSSRNFLLYRENYIKEMDEIFLCMEISDVRNHF